MVPSTSARCWVYSGEGSKAFVLGSSQSGRGDGLETERSRFEVDLGQRARGEPRSDPEAAGATGWRRDYIASRNDPD